MHATPHLFRSLLELQALVDDLADAESRRRRRDARTDGAVHRPDRRRGLVALLHR